MADVNPTKKPKHDWVSRKLWFSTFAIAILYLGMKGAIESAAFAAIYSTFTGGVVGICGLFLAGNVISDKITQKPQPKDP